jgi:hypothetical protein
MVYLIVYAIFAYLVMLGTVAAEANLKVKPNKTQFYFFVFAPVTLPVFLGFWMVHVMNLDMNRDQVKGPETPVKVEIVKP